VRINPLQKESHMSAVPTKPKPTAVCAASLLASAAKKSGKPTSHWSYPGEAGKEQAQQWLQTKAEIDECERKLSLLRDQIMAVVRPWYDETCAKRKTHEATVVIDTPTDTLRISFQHRYYTVPAEREEAVREALGHDYDRFMRKVTGLKIKKEITDDA